MFYDTCDKESRAARDARKVISIINGCLTFNHLYVAQQMQLNWEVVHIPDTNFLELSSAIDDAWWERRNFLEEHGEEPYDYRKHFNL